MTRRLRAGLLAALLAGVTLGCNGDSVPTGPTVVDVATQTFTGTLAVGASRFYSFTVTSRGSITASLASVTSAQDNTVLDAILELGIGFPAGTGCAVTTTKNVSPALTSQVFTSTEPGIHCVRVADVGDLNTPIKFAVRFAHP
jgi:hypothetical protein